MAITGVISIDLSTQRVARRELGSAAPGVPPAGVELGLELLHRQVPPGAEPLGPENAIVLTCSRFAGSLVPSSTNLYLLAKSPLTGLLAAGAAGSMLSAALRRTGYGGLMVTGKAGRPTVVLIDDGEVRYLDGSQLAGMSPVQSAAVIKERLGDPDVRVLAVGQAGEALARIAAPYDDVGMMLGRGGLGAVFGAKNLKAIAIRGTGRIPGLGSRWNLSRCAELQHKVIAGLPRQFDTLGSLANLAPVEAEQALPLRNFQRDRAAGRRTPLAQTLRSCKIRTLASYGCPAGYRLAVTHPQTGQTAILDYDSYVALGPQVGCDDLAVTLQALSLCAQYGLDPVSTGGVVAWAIEAEQKSLLGVGLLPPRKVAFGDGRALCAMIKNIGEGVGAGALLAAGTRLSAAEMGPEAQELAVHVRGLEAGGVDPLTLPGLALGLGTGATGELGYWLDPGADLAALRKVDGAAELTRDQEDKAACLEYVGLSRYTKGAFADFYVELADLVASAGGTDIDPRQFRLAGERVTNLKRLFNIAQGWQASRDVLPARLLENDLAPAYQAALQQYYALRGWTPEGLIPDDKVAQLRLAEWAKEVVSIG